MRTEVKIILRCAPSHCCLRLAAAPIGCCERRCAPLFFPSALTHSFFQSAARTLRCDSQLLMLALHACELTASPSASSLCSSLFRSPAHPRHELSGEETARGDRTDC
jgi:hypothetical protein